MLQDIKNGPAVEQRKIQINTSKGQEWLANLLWRSTKLNQLFLCGAKESRKGIIMPRDSMQID